MHLAWRHIFVLGKSECGSEVNLKNKDCKCKMNMNGRTDSFFSLFPLYASPKFWRKFDIVWLYGYKKYKKNAKLHCTNWLLWMLIWINLNYLDKYSIVISCRQLKKTTRIWICPFLENTAPFSLTLKISFKVCDKLLIWLHFFWMHILLFILIDINCKIFVSSFT